MLTTSHLEGLYFYTPLYHSPSKFHLIFFDVVPLYPSSLADLLGALLDEVALALADVALRF